jgi:hypothetical protein
MPQTLLFQPVFEATGGLLRVVFRRALDSRDSVVWLALAIGTRVVVATTALVPVVVAAAARVLFALATDGVVLCISLVFFISPGGDHVLEMGDGAWAAMTEVFKGATVIEAILEDDEDTNYITRTSTPAAPEAPRTSTPAAPEAPQAPSTPLGALPAQTSFPPPGPITRARARELNYIMLLKNEGPEA